MPDIPPDLTQLGSVGIIALALLGVVLAIRPLIVAFVSNQKELSGVNRELLTALRSSDRAHDRAADEIKALRQDATANQDEARTTAKAQSEALSTSPAPFVSPYLERPLRTEDEARAQLSRPRIPKARGLLDLIAEQTGLDRNFAKLFGGGQ